jgi:putative N-acetylmannosamine-6-phosphate epimerase
VIDILEDLRGGFAVACLAAEDRPLHPTHHVVAPALAAVEGRIREPSEARLAVAYGAMFVVVGSAHNPS